MTPEERAADINRRYPGYLNPFLEAQIAAAIRAAEQEAAAASIARGRAAMKEECLKALGFLYAEHCDNHSEARAFQLCASAIRARK